MDPVLRVFIGFDSREPAAFAVAMSSLIRHASRPISVTPLVQSSLRREGLYTRERKPNEATEFSLTRFLAPYLCGYDGYSLFVDCDVLFQADIFDLLLYAMAYPDAAIWCCQHDYVPAGTTKFDGHEQTKYPKKNWSSVLLLNNARCRVLTPDYVNTASGLDLHRFNWLGNDALIGKLALEWNYLVGEEGQSTKAPNIVHYTQGGPYFKEYADCAYSDEWWSECAAMLKPATTETIVKCLRPAVVSA